MRLHYGMTITVVVAVAVSMVFNITTPPFGIVSDQILNMRAKIAYEWPWAGV